ncbi:MAG: 3-oxoacyl-ACP reductase [uncultured Thiotrichaceae bacterium]|uniref:3-oxoacyl-ACP reductase n=1 Tax=uncultured Thiotrichaceae bacterium TaxID=298394 RepID=A0A6S6TKS5_9GAMM|nr:MAG: 3-oxoacyl-ACP reductase [uncultured Thiotrichaceae bacterium]
MLTHQELLNFEPSTNAFADKVILITGAGDGIGKAVAKAYAKAGATVILLSKTIKKLEIVYDEIVNAGHPEPAIYPMNLEGATAKDYADMADVIETEFGRLDGILLNAAALPSYTPIKAYDLEQWSKVITTNLHSNFLMLKMCLPLLEKAEDASVVFSSHHAVQAYNGAYGVAKSGLDALLRILSEEYDDAPFIRVNGVDSGPLRTKLRTFHYPGENPATLAPPEAIVGPYLYFMDRSAGKTTGEIVRFERLPANDTENT